MPLIVKWPLVVAPGSRNRDLVQNLDYAQTFIDIAGAERDKRMQGASLKPLLQGETPADWRSSIYYHFYEYPGVHMVARHYGIRTERYKLMHFYQQGEWEFYDLREDPEELRNLYQDASYTDKISDLQEQLTKLRSDYRDTTGKTP